MKKYLLTLGVAAIVTVGAASAYADHHGDMDVTTDVTIETPAGDTNVTTETSVDTSADASTEMSAGVKVGAMAPDFEATDTNGNPFKLSDHKGKVVVLEWTNHQCPFVQKHYETGNMQATQEEVRSMGAEWVTIVSSAPDMQGHVDAETANKITADANATPDVKILDESGEIGHKYEAKTTPHMFVIDAEGEVAYMGAIDDNPSANHDTVEGAHNYVLAAVESLQNDEEVEVTSTQPYGCGVKYKN